jgi:hypothetical protein
MSFNTNGDVVVADAAAANVTYSLVDTTGTRSVYSDRSRGIGVPRTLEISHQETGAGDAARLRSLVKLTDCKENPSAEGDVVENRVHIVLDSSLRITEKADVTDLLKQLSNMINDASFVDKIMNKES